MKSKRAKHRALQIRLKRCLVVAGIVGLASRRAIRAVIVLLGLERT